MWARPGTCYGARRAPASDRGGRGGSGSRRRHRGLRSRPLGTAGGAAWTAVQAGRPSALALGRGDTSSPRPPLGPLSGAQARVSAQSPRFPLPLGPFSTSRWLRWLQLVYFPQKSLSVCLALDRRNSRCPGDTVYSGLRPPNT